MKVLQINIVYKEKSTGRTCLEVVKALERVGYQGFVAYGKGRHQDKNTYRIGTDLEYYIHNLLSRITGLQGYFSIFATLGLINYIRKIDPDIIHLRNLHANYLNLPILFSYLKNKEVPVILNLHDCWAYTGKCPYYSEINCEKWKIQCSECKLLRKYPQSLVFDRTKKLFKDKKNWLGKIKYLTVIGVSEWIIQQAKMSFLKNRNMITVYNWIDQSVFYPRKEKILPNYGIDDSKFIILGVSASWIPGTPRYNDFIKLSELINDSMQIILVGESKVTNFPKNIVYIPFIHDVNKLALLYSCADVYVHLSVEDTFGKVVAEAQACGTPAIVYNSTALNELIAEGCGYIVNSRDISGIKKAINKVFINGKNYYSQKCLLNIKKKFDYHQNVKKLINLYELLLKDKNLYDQV
jgi:Glycosyltransferase